MSWWNPLSWFEKESTVDLEKDVSVPVVYTEGQDPLTGGDQVLKAGLGRIKTHVDAMIVAIDALNETPPEVTPEDPLAEENWRKSVRNRILASDGEKAAFFGTLSTEPTIRAADLEALGWERVTAANLVTERDKIRSMALSVSPLGTAPAPKE